MRRMRRSPTLGLVIVVSCLGALRGVPARAEDRAAAADTPVRSAPFDVAPEIARLHPGDRVKLHILLNQVTRVERDG